MSLSSEVKLSLTLEYPKKFVGLITGEKWFEAKREGDGAEGLWRIHDGLYDVREFVQSHPGGPSWLEMTKGTDITEAFESHHLSSVPEQMLKKFYVRKAVKPRNSPFTFEENGFYRTLKRNIQPVLKNVPKDTARTTDLMTDALVVATFLTAICACKLSSFAIGVISACLLTLGSIASHNHFHKRDNFRMYYFNLCLMDFRGWRVSHVLSHHLFTNTIYDLEAITWEVLAPHFPVKKPFFTKCRSFVTITLLWVAFYFLAYLFKILSVIQNRKVYVSDLMPFTLPLAMYLTCGVDLQVVLKMWLFIVTVSSFAFAAIGTSASHHHPDAFHEGDTPRAKKLDFGIHQLDTTYDRSEIKGNPFLVLTTFGDHALHHLFPTIDHGALQYLYPVFEETMKEFGIDNQVKPIGEMFVGLYRQLLREEPHLLPRGSRKT